MIALALLANQGSAATVGVCREIGLDCDFDSIEAAAAAAQDGDVIEFRETGTYSESVSVGAAITFRNVTAGEVVWTNGTNDQWALEVNDAAGTVAVDGVSFGSDSDNTGRRIWVASATLSLTGGSVVGGYAVNGGGVYVDTGGALSVNGTRFSANEATSYGGAIKVAVNGYADIVFASFDGNLAGYGAAIAVDTGTLTDLGSAFTNNIATDVGGAVYVYNGTSRFESSAFSVNAAGISGGDIAAQSGISVELDHTSHSGSTASLGWGGGLWATDLPVEVDGSTFTNLVAGAGGGAVEVDFSEFVGIYFASFDGNSSSVGGALYLYGNGTESIIEDTTFSGNSVSQRGGAVLLDGGGVPTASLRMERVTVENSFARFGGGVAALAGADLTFVDVRFEDNDAILDGGGLHATGADSVTFERVHLCRNDADSTGGGALLDDVGTAFLTNIIAVGNSSELGGAIHLHDTTGTVDHGTWVDNQALGGGAAFALVNATVTLSHNAVVESTGTALFAPVELTDLVEFYGAWWKNDIDSNVALDPGDLFVDPLFVSMDAGVDCGMNLHLMSGSELIDAGAPLPAEPDGTAQDIGAYGGGLAWGNDPGALDADGDGFTADEDCNDDDSGTFPGALERCDALDRDCNGVSGADQQGVVAWADQDGDTFGDPNVAVYTCGGAPFALNGLDCDDSKADVHPGAQDLWYDSEDTDCQGNDDFDADFDGFALAGFTNGSDCDDADPAIHPGALDDANDPIDQDCDGDAASLGLDGGGGCLCSSGSSPIPRGLSGGLALLGFGVLRRRR